MSSLSKKTAKEESEKVEHVAVPRMKSMRSSTNLGSMERIKLTDCPLMKSGRNAVVSEDEVDNIATVA